MKDILILILDIRSTFQHFGIICEKNEEKWKNIFSSKFNLKSFEFIMNTCLDHSWQISSLNDTICDKLIPIAVKTKVRVLKAAPSTPSSSRANTSWLQRASHNVRRSTASSWTRWTAWRATRTAVASPSSSTPSSRAAFPSSTPRSALLPATASTCASRSRESSRSEPRSWASASVRASRHPMTSSPRSSPAATMIYANAVSGIAWRMLKPSQVVEILEMERWNEK